MAMTLEKQLSRYEFQWKPDFSGERKRTYILGEKLKYVDRNIDNSGDNPVRESFSQDPNTFGIQEILKVAHNSTLIIPFNSNVGLAQTYNISQDALLTTYTSQAGTTTHIFGENVKRIGLQVSIIKRGRLWEIYQKGIEAMFKLTSNPDIYRGSLYLSGYDMYTDGTEKFVSRYKVAFEKNICEWKSDRNTIISSNIPLRVLQDYGLYKAKRHKSWGVL